MNNELYNWQEIKQRLPIATYLGQIGYKVNRENRFAARWRGSEDYNCAISPDGTMYYDHVEKDGGDIFKLCAIINGCSNAEANRTLGRMLGIRPDTAAKPDYIPRSYRPAEPKPKEPQAEATKPHISLPPTMPKPQEIAASIQPPMPKPTAAAKQDEKVEMFYGLPVSSVLPQTRYEELIAEGYTEVACYDYTDERGDVLYQVVRLENGKNKEFMQRVPGVGWGNIRDVRRVLYNLPNVIAASRVYVAEGEKAAQFLIDRGYCATTNSGGAKNWEESFSAFLFGKEVIILADNDASGIEHSRRIAQELLASNETMVKVIVPSNLPKGDIVNWLEPDRTNDDFNRLVERTPWAKRERIEFATAEQIELAKERNREPFCNYRPKIIVDDKGKEKIVKEPITLNELIADLRVRLLGFPYVLGSNALFDFDKDKHTVTPLEKKEDLVAWVCLKTARNMDFFGGTAYIGSDTLFRGLLQSCRRFDSISNTPEYPMDFEHTFYTHRNLPDATSDHRYFKRLVKFFNPNGRLNEIFIGAFFLTPLWKSEHDKPLWIIQSKDGRGVGKTTLVEKVAMLYSEPGKNNGMISISKNHLSFGYEELEQRLCATAARFTRIVLLDNLTNGLSQMAAENLAKLVTAKTISARPKFGAHDEWRNNNLNYVITLNDTGFSSDIIQRSVFIDLVKPAKRDALWNSTVNEYIRKCRYEIFADMVDLLEHRKNYVAPQTLVTRFPEWEHTVLQAACDNQEEYTALLNMLAVQKKKFNADDESAGEVLDALTACLAEVDKVQAANEFIFIRSDVIEKWFDKRNMPLSKIREIAKATHLSNILYDVRQFPNSSLRRRSGIMWRGTNVPTDTYTRTVKVLGTQRHGEIVIKSQEIWNSQKAEEEQAQSDIESAKEE